eukprot:Gregarina_sp_Poly_1__3240@NODE_1923_length_3069_cov_53_921053_g584_i2_p3_GENE_NODE_1923_length_3069_cov_53_921053_g584_i2NODE_1923_length_3069_cov_53_921053_g584_i2_p3_ORF_typecomplete_len160_score15_84_NODE_1923_length_3069_cov_53_921053_g584_i214561935
METLLGLKHNVRCPQVLAKDRVGFELTKRNNLTTSKLAGEVGVTFDPATHNDFDICFVFPLETSRATDVLAPEQVQKKIDQICRARIGKTLSELNAHRRLHPVYRIDHYLKTCRTRQDLAEMFKAIFFRVLDHIGAIYVVEEGQDKHRNFFVRVVNLQC